MAEPDHPPQKASARSRLRERLFQTACAALLIGAFFIPQEIPLEWYPLNNPGMDINYLEIKCASDKDGWVQLYYDATNGINDLDSIRFPISPTEQTYTYTFPLLDAPMVRLRLDPVADGGTLNVHHMRIINRREEEIRNFPIESFIPVQQIASITPLTEGWKITSTPGSDDPIVQIDLTSPIVPVGMNTRNLKRCLLSTGYLSMMLTILMLAVVTAFWKPASWSDFFRKIGLVAALSVPLAAIGNRGLIRNSIHYARFEPPPVAARSHHLVIEMTAPGTISSQLFWDAGHGFREEDSSRAGSASPEERKVLQFQLPAAPIRALRFDPHNTDQAIQITSIAIISDGAPAVQLPLDSIQPYNGIASLSVVGDALAIQPTPGTNDPSVLFTPAGLELINGVLRSAE